MQYQQLSEDEKDPQHIQSKEIINNGGSLSLDAGNTPAYQSPEDKRKKYIKWGVIGGIALIVVVLAIVLPLVLIKKGGGGNDDNGHGPLPPGQMNPYGSVAGSQQLSQSGAAVSGRLLLQSITNGENKQLMQAVPKQFLQQLEDTPVVSKKIGVDWRNVNFFGPNNQLKGNLQYTLDVVSQTIGRLVLSEGNETRYSIPSNMVSNNSGDASMRLEMLGLSMFDPTSKHTFGFQMVDVNNPANVLLSTIDQTLLFSDKYMQMDFQLPSQYVYGMGDRVHEFRLAEGAYSMWASGQDHSAYDDGKGRGGLSGVHPFVLVQTANPRRYIGLFFRNSNAMTPVLRYNDDGLTSTLSFITIGGQLEVYIFAQGSAHEVIQNYQQFINLPRLPPFWALGWQEGSPNKLPEVNEQGNVATAAQNWKTNNYPLDAVYLSASSLDEFQDFTLDITKFPKIGDLSTALKGNNQKLIAYIDSAVNVQDTSKNPTYKAGKLAGAFIKSAIHGDVNDGFLVNYRMNKKVVFLDWLNDQCVNFWSTQVQSYLADVPFDGLWTIMNEPYTVNAGELGSDAPTQQTPEHLLEAIQADLPVQGGEETPYDQSWFFSYWPLDILSTYLLPFVPGMKTQGNYDENTISLNATHVNSYTDFDVHSLYAHGMMAATVNSVMNKSDNRPFILTKGSFAGTGKHTPAVAHTLQDRTWSQLYYGIQSTLRSQMFGLPLSGADVCGYYSNAETTALDEELCLRWYQVATFFPLARHKQSEDGPRTEPFNLKNVAYQTSIRKSMHDRMQYLRLLYTCMFETSDSGGTCLDPLQFRFAIPDTLMMNEVSFTSTFMVAGSIKVSPIVNSTTETTFMSYFPQGFWVNLADWSEVIVGNDCPERLQIRDTVNAHLAPGAVIPWQDNSDMKVNTTADVLLKPISLVANRDSNGQAGGSLFLDQGVSRDEMYNKNYEYYSIQVQANSVQVQPAGFNKNQQTHQLDQIVLLNATDLSEGTFACYYKPDSLEPQPMQTSYNATKKAFTITPLAPLRFSEILNVYYGSSATDLNLCNPHSFEYDLADGVLPNLTQTSVSFNLTHRAKTLANITMTVGFFDTGIVNVKWTWANQSASGAKRVPMGVPESLVNGTWKDQSQIFDTLDKYITITDQPFVMKFSVRLTAKPETILTIKGLLFDEYLNWVNVEANVLPAASQDDFRGVFGLGQRATQDFFFKDGVYSLYTRDIDNPLENGRLPGKEVYGVHPFYMFHHAKNSWVGVFHNSAQAQDWWISSNHTLGNVSLSTISTGGLGDIYVLLSAQKPESIIAKYHSLVGTPVLAPQWALGWNQCKWCYRDTEDVQQSMQGYADNGIPLDTQWVDIDYMQDYKDFTYEAKDALGNPGSFAGLPNLVNTLHARHMKFVPIVDAGISYRPQQGYQAFDQGMKDDVFMKVNGNVFVGKVWPNEAAYPDFFHPKADAWWGAQLDTFSQALPFDGLWQDMNEASNFCNGNCHGDQPMTTPVSTQLPYTPTGNSLESKAISLDVKHYNNLTQLDAHSLFAATQVRSSNKWFTANKKRTMVISRSSYAGSGKFGSTWLGDNHATELDMEVSVLGVMNMNVMGIPLTGADICGFGGSSTTKELCTRWHAVGAFYPFSRNHRDCQGKSQEAWRWNTTTYSGNTTYTDLMKASIFRKYHLMRYYYTQLTQVSLGNNTYYVLYKPLFFEFPEDKNAYNDIANNVMIGGAIKTSVNAKNISQATTDFYFPAGTWCSLFDNIGECIYNEFGQNVTLGSQLNQSYAHLREGFIIPMQNATKLKAKTTWDLQQAPVDLHILGSFRVPGIMSWSAEGQYVNDDGENTQTAGNMNQYRIVASYSQSVGEQLTITVSQQMTATNMFKPVTNCSDVNKADYLQNIYVYNATAFKQHDVFFVQVIYNDDIEDYQNIGTAQYDAATNRLVFDNVLGNLVCLTNVFRIVIKNLSTPSSQQFNAAA